MIRIPCRAAQGLIAALAFVGLAFSSGSHAQNAYPAKPVRVIVPAAPSDSCDVLTRLVAPKLAERLGQPFTVDNRVGGAGQLGLQMLAQAPADGYTIGCGQGGNLVIVPLAYQKVQYDAQKDFAPIAMMASNFLALVVNPNVPFQNVRDLITYAKANPGKVSFGTNGEGAFLHFATELLARDAGFTYLHVPYKAISTAVAEVMGGRIDAILGSFISLQPHVVSGKLRMLGIARTTRAPNYPEFPTIADTVPGFASGGWFGLIAPAGTPKDIIALLNRETNRALAQPDVRERMTALGLEVHTEPPEFFTTLLKADLEKWGKLVRDINFKPL